MIIFSISHSICKRFDEISDRCQEMPDNTAEIVSLEEYVKDARAVKVIQLQTEVDEAAERLIFLLDYATLPGRYYLDFFCSKRAKFDKDVTVAYVHEILVEFEKVRKFDNTK